MMSSISSCVFPLNVNLITCQFKLCVFVTWLVVECFSLFSQKSRAPHTTWALPCCVWIIQPWWRGWEAPVLQDTMWQQQHRMDMHTTATPILPAVKSMAFTVVKPIALPLHLTLRHAQEIQVQPTAFQQVLEVIYCPWGELSLLFRKTTGNHFSYVLCRPLCSW